MSPICQIGSSGVSGTVEAIDALSSSLCAFVILCLWFGGREGVSRDRFNADTGWAADGGCFLDLKLYGMVDFDEKRYRSRLMASGQDLSRRMLAAGASYSPPG